MPYRPYGRRNAKKKRSTLHTQALRPDMLMHFGLYSPKKARPYGLAVESKKGNPGLTAWVAVYTSGRSPEVYIALLYTLFFLEKRKVWQKKNHRISWAVRPRRCLCPSGKTNEINLYLAGFQLEKLREPKVFQPFGVKTATFHCEITVSLRPKSSFLLQNAMHTPMHTPMHLD